jgi:protein-S-isoprenylcysteine O-methyltransferase Ste14
MRMIEEPTLPIDTLAGVQARRRATLAITTGLVLTGLLFVDSYWRYIWPDLYEDIEFVGVFLIFIGIFGRTWCTLYIGGRKKGQLVEHGPYSLVRNPLYLFSLIAALGIGAQTGSILLAVLIAILVALVLVPVVGKEEAFLENTFGQAYRDYAARVPRFWPSWDHWRDVDELVIKPSLVRQTFVEASLFLIAIPLADCIEWSQQLGWLPILFRLP